MSIKISDFASLNTPSGNDIIPIIDVSEPNTANQNKKITVDNLLTLAGAGGGSPLPTNTKGDIIAHNGTTNVRVPVGTDGKALIADSTTGTGLSWQPIPPTTPTTTEGDLIVRKTASDQRLPIGSDGQVLTVDSTLNGKLKWAAPVSTLPTTTKGDIIAHNGTTNVRLSIGSDGEALIADSAAGSGLRWQPTTPTTTEGDLIVRKAISDQRLPIGSDGEVLTVDTAVNGKLKWAAPAAGTASPLTTLGDIYVRNNTTNARLPLGTDGQVLTVDTSVSTFGLKWATPTVSSSSPLTTLGDLYVRNNTTNTRLPIGTDGQVLSVDTAAGSSLSWVPASPLTTIGDIYVRNNAGNTRLPLGTDGQVLTVDTSISTLGLKWAAPSGGSSSPLTTKGDIQIFASAVTRLPVGSNGQVLTADSSVANGVKWSGSSVPGIGNKALYVLDGTSIGNITTTGTSISFAAAETITGTLGLNFTNSVGSFISSSLDANRWIVSGCVTFQSTTANCRVVVYPNFVAGVPAKSAVDLVPWGSGTTGPANTPMPIHIHGIIDHVTATNAYNFSILAKGSAVCTMPAENTGTNLFSRISIFRAS